MKTTTKYIFAAFVIISWGTATYLAGGDPEYISETKVEQPLVTNVDCVALTAEKKSLESEAARLVSDAFTIEATSLKDEISKVIAKKAVTTAEKKILEKYLAFDMRKALEEKPSNLTELINEDISNASKVESILDTLLINGEIESYWPKEVQDLGQQIRFLSAQAKELVTRNEICFKLEAEVNRMVDKAQEATGEDDSYSGWTAKRDAQSLMGALR